MLDQGQAFWFHGDISGLTNRRKTIDTKSGLTQGQAIRVEPSDPFGARRNT